MNKCNLCGKKEKRENLIFYSEEEYNLCRSHYLKWLRNHRPYREKHKKVKPGTKAWHNMCVEEENLFRKWFKKQQPKQNAIETDSKRK